MSTDTAPVLTTDEQRKFAGLDVGPVKNLAPYINMLVYGDPGVGKTWLGGSASDVEDMGPVLYIDVEGGTLTLREHFPLVDVVRVQSWSDMAKVYNALKKGEGGYRTVVLDSLTEIQKFSMETIMRDLVAAEPDRDPDVPGMREWGKNINQLRTLVRRFRDLPMNVIFTALSATDKDGKTGKMFTRVNLSGKLSGEVPGFVDIVMYMYVKEKDGEIQRLLLTGATDKVTAKDRSNKLPPVIEQPSMSEIHKLIYGKESE